MPEQQGPFPPQQMQPQQNQIQSLLQAYLPSVSNSAQDQVQAQELLRQLSRMNQLDTEARGIRGYFGKKKRARERPALQEKYGSALADAMMSQSRSADIQDQIGRFRDIAQQGITANQSAQATASYRPKTDWERYMQDPNVYKDFKEASRNPAVNVYPNTPETAQQAANLAAIKTRTQNTVGENQKLMEQGAKARKTIPSYNMGLKLLENVTTGPFTEKLNYAKKLANTFGMNIDLNGVSNYEQLSPIFGQFLFQGIQQTKGSVSDKEMKIFKEMNANYEYTTEGNRRLLTYAKSRAERDVEIRSLVRNLRKQGKSPADISEAADKYIQDNDMSGKLVALVTGGESDNTASMSDEDLIKALSGG